MASEMNDTVALSFNIESNDTVAFNITLSLNTGFKVQAMEN